MDYYTQYNIPRNIQVAGRDISIEFDDMLIFNSDRLGEADYREQKIRLMPSVDKYPVTQQSLRITFWHEILHWILYVLEEHQANNEDFVGRVSEILFQIDKQFNFYDNNL